MIVVILATAVCSCNLCLECIEHTIITILRDMHRPIKGLLIQVTDKYQDTRKRQNIQNLKNAYVQNLKNAYV